MTISEFIHLE